MVANRYIVCYYLYRKHLLQSGCLECRICPYGRSLSCGSDRIGIIYLRGWHKPSGNAGIPIWRRPRKRKFFSLFRLFLLSRKASNATTNIPKAINKDVKEIIIETISNAVMNATSLLMYNKFGRLPPCHRCFLEIIVT